MANPSSSSISSLEIFFPLPFAALRAMDLAFLTGGKDN
jgi:hypothetical protein